ncbi:MAG: hypothetical protein K0S38_287 [Candidatus Paceibacter sp.]|jgi:hypothetical protein|nr:hypothetical protein [Candidatus Paceibacter sp.]
MHIDTTILIYILSGVAVLLVIWIVRLEIRLARLLIGKNAKTLEDSFVTISKDLKDLHQFTKEMEHYLANVETRLKRSVQSIETTRFNPFKGTGSGGNQSFSATFVNEKGDGVVLTSMYARDRISMFAKPLKVWESEFELSEEEKESIEKSKQSLIG